MKGIPQAERTRARIAPAALAAAVAGLLLLGGCGGGEQAGGGDAVVDSLAAAIAGGAPQRGPATGPGGLVPTKDAINYESAPGRFKTVFPPGCPRIRVRSIPSERTPDANSVVWSFCDRSEQEGYMVSVYFEVEHQGPPVPADVLQIIEQMLARSSLEILRQAPISRNGADGVLVLAREAGGERCMWIEGFLAHNRMVVASAWWPDLGLFSDIQTLEFFSNLEILP